MDMIEKIEQYRERAGLSKADMAREFGVREQNYNNWTYRGSLPKTYYATATKILDRENSPVYRAIKKKIRGLTVAEQERAYQAIELMFPTNEE